MNHRTSWKLATTLIVASAAMAMGCTDTGSPTSTGLKPNLAVGDVTNVPQAPVVSKLLVCKSSDSNISGSFTVVRTSGTGAFQAAVTVAPGKCVEVANYPATDGTDSRFTVTENAAADPANTTQALVACTRTGTPTDCFGNVPNPIFINGFHGFVLTYKNVFTPPPPPKCVFTKGWYRNQGSSTVIAVDGRTIAQVQAILDATPGKPGSVTFGGDNTLLNLYQQLLTALENLGGNPLGGPPAVDAAIAAAQAGTDGSGLNITTTLTQTQMSDLINVLDAFNEGTFVGFPHCDD